MPIKTINKDINHNSSRQKPIKKGDNTIPIRYHSMSSHKPSIHKWYRQSTDR